MAYVPGNLSLVSAPLGGVGAQVWSLFGTDAAADADASGFISDGGKRGMRVGDVVIYRVSGTPATALHTVVTVSATYPGAVDLSNLYSVTNSD
jgi:hypothetical protein